MSFNLPEEQDPNAPLDQKLTEEGVTVFTKGGAAGYPILRACVGLLKVFDHEGFEEYSKIKGNGSIFGKKTAESRKAAYEYAFKRAGNIILGGYNSDFTSGSEQDPKSDEGEEWKSGGE